MANQNDIVPELWEKINSTFMTSLRSDAELLRIYHQIKGGSATHLETQEFSFQVAKLTADALAKNILPGTLPNDTMYWNIAQRILAPLIGKSHDIVMAAARQIQASLNTAAGLGLKPITPELDNEIVNGLMNSASNAKGYEEVKAAIGEPVENTIRHFANDFIKANADFHARAGLDPKIARYSRGDAKVCAWCRGLTYSGNYDDRPDEIFRRHSYCRCIVLYTPSKDAKVQDVTTKKEYNDVREALKAADGKTFLTRETKRGLIPVNSNNKWGIVITNKSFGSKIKQHAKDYGLIPSQANDRRAFLRIIDNIINTAEEIFPGEWRGQDGRVVFFLKGEDVVVVNNKEFVTILKGGINNARVKAARKR
ncbi:MAG: hypothetical protein LBN36_07680 [Clostridiales Family XIII bacterium]|jgi:hypothetical protein|nr:hypothetical protein [Clostridiales Family XIII bacterium]